MPKRLLRWFSGAMVAAAPTLIKVMFNLEWLDSRIWFMFMFTFVFGACAYAEGLLDGTKQ